MKLTTFEWGFLFDIYLPLMWQASIVDAKACVITSFFWLVNEDVGIKNQRISLQLANYQHQVTVHCAQLFGKQNGHQIKS